MHGGYTWHRQNAKKEATCQTAVSSYSLNGASNFLGDVCVREKDIKAPRREPRRQSQQQPGPNGASQGEMPQEPSRAGQTAVPFQYESTSHTKINTQPDNPANPLSLPVVTPPKAGGRLTARRPGRSQAPQPEGGVQEPRCSPGASGGRPPPAGQSWSPATQRSKPRALDTGARPGAGRHIWSPHAGWTRPAVK